MTSLLDVKYNEQQEAEALAAKLQEGSEKLTAAHRMFAATSDGETAVAHLARVVDGFSFYVNVLDVRDEALFQAGLRDVYLQMLAHCLEDDSEHLVLGGDLCRYDYPPLAHEEHLANEEDALARAFTTKEGQYILGWLRAAYYDVSPALAGDEVMRLAGQRTYVAHILSCIKDYRRKQSNE